MKEKKKSLKDERDALYFALKAERGEIKRLNDEIVELKRAAEKDKVKYREKEKALTEKTVRYDLAEKSVRAFLERVERFSEEPALNKREIVTALKEILDDKKLPSGAERVLKMTEILKREEDEANFDIDAALNCGDLDLKQLCEEFGVYKG